MRAPSQLAATYDLRPSKQGLSCFGCLGALRACGPLPPLLGRPTRRSPEDGDADQAGDYRSREDRELGGGEIVRVLKCSGSDEERHRKADPSERACAEDLHP